MPRVPRLHHKPAGGALNAALRLLRYRWFSTPSAGKTDLPSLFNYRPLRKRVKDKKKNGEAAARKGPMAGEGEEIIPFR
jgi:hypothetical protein